MYSRLPEVMRHCWYVRSGCRQPASDPETGSGKSIHNLREADFWPECFRVTPDPGHLAQSRILSLRRFPFTVGL